MTRASRNRPPRWWPSLSALPLVLSGALLLTACGGTPTQKSSPKAPASAADSTDADEAVARALNTWATEGGNTSQALAQIQKASQLAPQRPEILWLYLRICMEVRGCAAESIEAQLRNLDAKSGSVWLGALARAQARKDARAEEQLLEVMSKATHFNVYWTTLIVRLTPPISRFPTGASSKQEVPTPLTNGLNTTVGWLSRLNVSAFQPVSRACDQERVRDPATRVRCELIAQALQKSDTVLAEGSGLGIAQRLAVPDSAEAQKIAARIDTLRYQNQKSGAVVAVQMESEKFSDQLLKLMAQLPREQDVAGAILRWAREPMTP